MRVFKPWSLLTCLVMLVATTACGPGNQQVDPTSTQRPVQRMLLDFDQKVVMPSSILSFRMKGSDRLIASAAEVVFEGQLNDGRDLAVTLRLDSGAFERANGDHGDILVKVPVENQLWNEVNPGPSTTYTGALQVDLIDELGLAATARLEGMTLEFRSDITPDVSVVQSGDYFINQNIPVTGNNFLRPEEGTTWAVLDGVFSYADGVTPDRAVASGRLGIRWSGSRTSANFHIDPAVFGVQLGTFTGAIRFENELRTGALVGGNSQPTFVTNLQPTFLARLDPPAGSRGQRINFVGRGFVESNEQALYGMVYRFEGVFTFDDGGELDLTGANALERQPDSVLSDETAQMAVWYEIIDGRLYGLGANPGVFEGSITPILFDSRGEQLGEPWQGTFRINPTKQMVFIKYLPGFSKGLEKYGLANVELEIRQRILEVTNRDYDGVNVEFVDSPPTDFIDFATIEIGGPDPTGGGKFGYDNTCNVQSQKCKDTSNLYLADYLGGVNAASADEFNTPFGGVFIESFDYFSPTLHPENEDGAPEFDRILSPFMHDLGGEAVRGTEFPGGPRDAAIREAIHMVGSVIGNTCTHEVGHSIGLAFFPQDLLRPGEAFHNKIPCDDCIMDSGSERPFVERGEIDGAGPAKFNERNWDYLKDILPEP